MGSNKLWGALECFKVFSTELDNVVFEQALAKVHNCMSPYV